MSLFNLKGFGPKKEQSLIDAGYDSIEKIKNANFYEIMHLPGFGYKTTVNLWSILQLELQYIPMEEVLHSSSENIIIENKVIKPWKDYKKKSEFILQPSNFKTERTTVWSFPDRGEWASHTPQYRGNWSPRVVRNIIELYSKPGDVVLDPMVGGGTTPVECKLTGRNSISVDINPGAISITRDRLQFPDSELKKETEHRTFIGDVRNLNLIQNSSVDLIATHPPYANMIKYAPSVDGDLSQIMDYSLFFAEYRKAISEMYRVLKPGSHCAILIGDTHNKSHYVPISIRMMMDYLKQGFILKEDIIKKEWNCESDRYLSKYAGANFLLTMHEHLFIFKKPNENEKLKNSSLCFFE